MREGENTYSIGEKEFSLYQAASGDWCVTVSEYGKEEESFNLGSREAALDFILADFVVETAE